MDEFAGNRTVYIETLLNPGRRVRWTNQPLFWRSLQHVTPSGAVDKRARCKSRWLGPTASIPSTESVYVCVLVSRPFVAQQIGRVSEFPRVFKPPHYSIFVTSFLPWWIDTFCKRSSCLETRNVIPRGVACVCWTRCKRRQSCFQGARLQPDRSFSCFGNSEFLFFSNTRCERMVNRERVNIKFWKVKRNFGMRE